MRRHQLLLGLTFLGLLIAPSASAASTRPNLQVSFVKTTASVLAPGESLTATVTVRNRGNAIARRSRIYFWLSRNSRVDRSDLRLATARVGALKHKQKRRVRVKVRLTLGVSVGAHELIVCADGAKQLRESNERDNCRATALSVVAPTLPTPPAPIDSDSDGVLDPADSCPHDADPCDSSVYDVRKGLVAQGELVEIHGLVVTAVSGDQVLTQLDNDDPDYAGALYSGIRLYLDAPQPTLQPGDCIRVFGVVDSSNTALSPAIAIKTGGGCSVLGTAILGSQLAGPQDGFQSLLVYSQLHAATSLGDGYRALTTSSPATFVYLSPDFIGTLPALDSGFYTVTGIFETGDPYPVIIPREASDIYDESTPPG